MTIPPRMRLGLLALLSALGLVTAGLVDAQTADSGVPPVSLPATTVAQSGTPLPSTTVSTSGEAPTATVSAPSVTAGPVSTPPVTISTPSAGQVTTPVTSPPAPRSAGGSTQPTGGSARPGEGLSGAHAASAAAPSAPAATANRGSRAPAPRSTQPARSGRATRPAGGSRTGAHPLSRAGVAGPSAGAGSSNVSTRAPGTARPRSRARARGNALDSIGRHIPLPLPVPDWSKPIILALLLLALWLGVRSRVAALRARALERQRAALMRDVGFMQAALVPEVPSPLGGLAVSVAYRPAEGPAAGGDFYDVFTPATGKVAVILGDVAGHGHDALRQAALIRYTLRAYMLAGLEPRMALALAGRTLGQPRGEYFATIAVGIYDRRDSRLTYSLAGHPPPIFTGFDAPEPLTICSSAPVGWTMPTGRRQTTLTLPAGSEICFFSDGLLEARLEQGSLLGRERLTSILHDLGAGAQARDLLAQVRAAALKTPDDMAACILAPEAGASRIGTRVEELEADAGELRGGEVERFLEACRVPGPVIAGTIEHAAGIAEASGTVVLRIELGAAGATVTAQPGTVPDLVPPTAQPAEDASGGVASDRGGSLVAQEPPALATAPRRRASDRQPSATA